MIRTKYKQSRYCKALNALALEILMLLGLFAFGGTAFARTFVVDSLELGSGFDEGDSDPGDGVCENFVGECTFRAAIEESNEFPEVDTIVFSPTLNFDEPLRPLFGQYVISDSVSIIGPTDATFTIDARGLNRHFFVSEPQTSVRLSNVTLINGRAEGPGLTDSNGGSIYLESTGGESSTLSLSAVTIQNSFADNDGGALYALGSPSTANVELTNVRLISDTADEDGGGIYVDNGSVTMVNSYLTENRSLGDGIGGAGMTIFNSSALIASSTFAGNRAEGSGSDGGAIAIRNGDVEIVNSTISGNLADLRGGGILNSVSGTSTVSTLSIQNSTIVNNIALSDEDAGGGIHNSGSTSSVSLRNTILAENVVVVDTPGECFSEGGFESEGFNLTTTPAQSGCVYDATDQIVAPDLVFTEVVDPDLADNGGPTLTHALLPESPAIDGGDNCPPPTTDQRGMPRSLGTNCDVGSYEFAFSSIALSKTLGTTSGCAATSVLDGDIGDMVSYCLIIRNTGNVTLTDHTIDDDRLNISDEVVSVELAPGAALEIDRNRLAALGPYTLTINTNNTVSVTSTVDDEPTVLSTIPAATATASSVFTSNPVTISMAIAASGSEIQVTRTIVATIRRDVPNNQVPVANRLVQFRVTGGTSVSQEQISDVTGRAVFTYVSTAPAPPVGTAADIDSTAQITDFIEVWVDLNRNGAFDAGEPRATDERPTAITLASFSAQIVDDRVLLVWRTGAEIDNAGFNLYRAHNADGPYTRVNAQLIAGQGTGMGATYSYVDENPGGAFYYKLEDVDYFGRSTLHGPFEATVAVQIYLPNVEQP